MGSFLHRNKWCDAVRESAEMFDLNCVCVVPGFMNLWSVFNVMWFLVVRNPLEDTHIHRTQDIHTENHVSTIGCQIR